MKHVYLRGIGAAVPNHVVPNETLSKLNGIEPAWIVERTGIERRTLSNSLEKTSTLATTASREAMETAGVAASEVDLLVLATSFPDSMLPQSTAGVVKDRLRLGRAVAIDISTPAIGFVLALQMAHRYLIAGAAETAVVVGAECFSSFNDLRDRRTCYLFGDAAGAMLLSTSRGFATLGAPTLESLGPVVDAALPADARTVSERAYSLPLYHQPPERLQEAFEQTLKKLANGEKLEPGQLHWVLPQQMQSAAVEQAGSRLRLPGGVLFQELLRSANLLSATLPLSFYHLAVSRSVSLGHRVALLGTDGRYLWGGAVVTVTGPLPDGFGETPTLPPPSPELPGPRAAAEKHSNFRHVTDLPAVLAEEVRKADVFGASLSTIFFTVGHPGRLSRSMVEQMGRETRLILSRQIRKRDLVVEVTPDRYAVILPNQDASDARRIAERLKALLEKLDPVEEIEVRALYDLLTFAPGAPVDAYVGEVVKRSRLS